MADEKIKIDSKQLSNIIKRDCQFNSIHIVSSSLIKSAFSNTLLEGIFISGSNISILSLENTSAKGLVVNGESKIQNVYAENVHFLKPHVFVKTEIWALLSIDGIFHQGVYRHVTFKNSVFVGTTFHECKFANIRFDNCDFIECLFENCEFKEQEKRSSFFECNFKPDTPYGRFLDEEKQWPNLASRHVGKTHFLKNGGNIKFEKCSNEGNISSSEFVRNIESPSLANKIGHLYLEKPDNQLSIYKYFKGWLHNSSSDKSNVQQVNTKIEKNNICYKFTTVGLK